MKINEMINELFNLKSQFGKLEESGKKIKEQIEKMKFQIMDYLEQNCLQNIKDEEGRMVYQKEPAVHATIKAESKDQAYAWLKLFGYDYAVQPSIHHSVLSKIMKERIANGDHIPEELFSYFLQKDIGTRI